MVGWVGLAWYSRPPNLSRREGQKCEVLTSCKPQTGPKCNGKTYWNVFSTNVKTTILEKCSLHSLQQVLRDALDKLRNTVPRKLKDIHLICWTSNNFSHTIYWFWCEELRDSVEADLKQCALLDNVWFEQFYIREKLSRLLQNNVILVRFESWLHFRRRLDNLPASGAGVDATDFFLSFKLACEAVGWLLRKIQQTGPTGFELFQCISNISKCIIYHQHWTLAKVYRRSWSLLLRPVSIFCELVSGWITKIACREVSLGIVCPF